MKDKFLKSIQRKSWLLLALFFISSCSNEDIVKHPVITNKYDPSKPQALTGFIPEKGGIGDKIIVQGNFGTDLSKMKVIFADTKEANIISSDGTSIYCTVPSTRHLPTRRYRKFLQFAEPTIKEEIPMETSTMHYSIMYLLSV